MGQLDFRDRVYEERKGSFYTCLLFIVGFNFG